MSDELKKTAAQGHLKDAGQTIDDRLKHIEERAAELAAQLERERDAMHATNSPPQSLQAPPLAETE